MASTNFVVDSLPAWVQVNKDVLLKNFALVGTATRKRISLQTGVKKAAKINYFELTPVFQDGTECEFQSAGAATLTQRDITTAMIKWDLDICPRSLVGTYAEYLVRIKATSESLPFEQYIMESAVAEINKGIEKMIWQGDVTQTSDNILKWIDGFLEIASDASVTNVTLGTNAYEGILAVIMALPEEVLERGAEVFVSPAVYRAFMMEMVNKNYYHYAGAQNSAPEEFIFPGTDIKVVKTPGLAGSLKILGTFPKNLFYATDMQGDEEDIDLWYSKDDRVFKMEALWNSGVQIAFPNLVVTGTFSAAPTLSPSIASSAATIASAVNEDGQIETHPNE